MEQNSFIVPFLFCFFKHFVGEYLWEHIMQGELRSRPDNLYKHGEKTINNIKYRWVSSVYIVFF